MNVTLKLAYFMKELLILITSKDLFSSKRIKDVNSDKTGLCTSLSALATFRSCSNVACFLSSYKKLICIIKFVHLGKMYSTSEAH